MKRKVARLRLSPNEEARIIREEHERRRKLRIQQVREQQRDIALQIRREVERRRQRELEKLEEELRADWERQQREKLNALQKLYEESLQLLGQGHRSAKENEPDLAAIAQKEVENHIKAEERYREALKELKSQKLKDHEKQTQSINARKKALQTEKERAAKVASLPPPPPNPIQQNIDYKKLHVVKKSDVSAFAATHYHMSGRTVDREVDMEQPDAHEEAELEARRLQELQREEKQRREEQLEKARLRGKQALKREHLVQDRERLLVELEHMQQTDLLRRRQQVSQMPAQIFQPLYKRQETREDFQREMEFAFEDMYTGERRVKGDLVVQLVPEPLPALSTGSQDRELDVTVDEDATPGTENTQHDTEQEAESAEMETSAQVELSRPAPRKALKKLLDRIRTQRNHWAESNSDVPAADSQTAISDQIPERDMTIDTGSLTSEEKEQQPTTAPAAMETTEQSAAAETLHPDFANRIQEFEEERKKREEELEREKQQQVLLLQELETQKAKLEQMLLEARQEREHLKAAVTQEVPIIKPPEVPVHDQEISSVSSGPATELVPPPGEDDHTRRIREYQQRLLEQNRVHQRSVEVARQRLDEYQRALQIRYNMTATKMPLAVVPPAVVPPAVVPPAVVPPAVVPPAVVPPAVVPPGLFHPPLQNTRPVHLPAPLPLFTPPSVPAYIHPKPQPFVEVPTRESDISASPPHLPSSSLRVCSRLQGAEAESVSDSLRNQRPDVSAWLTENIMERVTGHLPDRVRPSSATKEPHKPIMTHHSASIPLQPATDPVRVFSSSITDTTPLVQSRAVIRPATSPHDSLYAASLNPRDDDMERQRWELQEVQRRVMEQREAMVLQQRQQEEERQRQELQEVQRRVMEQREAVVLQQRQQEEERQRQELQEVQRRVMEQREAMVLQQRQQQEERQRREGEMTHMKQQKETLQALIQTDAPPPEAASDELVSENINQTRLKLLASLLKAIEESNGGTLSHLEDRQEREDSSQQLSSNSDPVSQGDVPVGPPPALVLPSALLPPRAAKPPVTRVKLGIMGMTEQHELSAIQEAETTINSSQITGLEESARVPPHNVDWDPHEESESSVASDRTLPTPSSSSSEQRTAVRRAAPGSSSERSSYLVWRERLLMGAGTSPESSESDLVRRMISPLSSDSGRGADYSGPAVTICRSPTESAHRPRDSDCLSSTSISTGSYITTDPEQNADKSPPLAHLEERRAAVSLDVSSSPSGQSFGVEESSAAVHPGVNVESLFNESSIQQIIDRYTRELNFSLSATGKTAADGRGSFVEELDFASVSQQSLVQVSERRGEDETSAVSPTLPSNAAEAQRSRQEWDETVNPILEHFSGEDRSLQDSFRPLIGQLTDQSSCLAADHRDSAMERLVGQPSAHSSVIGQLPGVPVPPVSLDQGGWDSTLSRMIGRLSHQSSSHWLSGGQDFYAGQLIGQMVSERSTSWFDGEPEESRMRPLVGELDESAGQHSGSSGDRTRVALGVSTEASVPSYPALPPEASSHSASVPDVDRHSQDRTLQNRTSQTDLGPERTEVFPGSDSFHPLLAEVTHNETADASTTFHLPEHNVPESPEGQRAGSVSTSPEARDDSSESESSPERLRAEQPSSCVTTSPALDQSLTQLVTSQNHPPDVELTALSLSNLTVCDDAPAASVSQPEEPFSESEQSLNLRSDVPVLEIMEAAGEKGILEQSEITLVSLTDTTLQDPETTITDEDELQEDKHPAGAREEGQEGNETEGSESALTDETPEEKNQTQPVTLLEIQWVPDGGLQEVFQQKRRALIQRSTHRIEEIKAKRALSKTRPESREKSKDSQPVSCKSKTKSKGGRAEQNQTTETSGLKQKKPQLPPSVKDSRLKKVDEIKICTPEQRRLDVSEMHQRTQRLYEQLEEVKRQKAIRSRREASAQNRLKAKEFHKKTLQKLRAKQQ
ncbi:centrosomal protein of 295 kDa isoform X2 [Sparus aurata]|uniref:centrosomal protein of 295 kDa isoform X2 n=1 Tax=Sparus aurata TaxID=8175 RepID=UPI0011C152BE|nr:centrosomal protein of 295 kDa isoform X2 [Sparus aurata]